jgi:protein gp37
MAEPKDLDAAWWDHSWNPAIGCEPCGPGCTFCYVPPKVADFSHNAPWLAGAKRYADIVEVKGKKRPRFNGNARNLPPGHHEWTFPLRWAGPEHSKLGPGAPGLIFVTTMGDLLFEKQPDTVIDRVLSTVAVSKHIGLVVTRRSERARDYFSALDPRTARLWRPKIWLAFSACDQAEFDKHWANMRTLAESGWFVFVSCAPLIGPIKLPDDFLGNG